VQGTNLSSRNTILALHAINRQNQATRLEQPHTESVALAQIQGFRSWVLTVDSFLRNLGFYGYFVLDSNCPRWTARACVGYRTPEWLSSWSVSCGLELTSSALSSKELGISITSGYMRIQNRVSINSDFMRACQRGDVELVRQNLANGTGSVRDRTVCLGKTPLLVRFFPAFKGPAF